MKLKLPALLLTLAVQPCFAGSPVASLPEAASLLEVAQVESALAGMPTTITLPGGRAVQFAMRAEALDDGSIGIRGASATGDRIVLFVPAAGRLHGDIHAMDGRYRLVTHVGREFWVHQQDYAHEATLARDLNVGVDDVLRDASPASVKATGPDREAPAADGKYEVDVLVVYTPRFEESLGGRIEAVAEVQRTAFVANTYFDNSAIPIRYRVLRAEKYTGTQESAGGKRNLRVLSREPAIRAYRDQIGADLVLFLRTPDGRADLAISSPFNGDDKNDPPQDVQPDRDIFVVSYGGTSREGVGVEDFLTPHELGHTFGGGHNYSAHYLDGLYWKPYAHGKDCGQFIPGGRYVSVMSYGELTTGQVEGVPVGGLPTSPVAGQFEVRGDFFSSPLISRDGSQCGSEGATEAEQADNARAIPEAAPYVAAYRKAKTKPSF